MYNYAASLRKSICAVIPGGVRAKNKKWRILMQQSPVLAGQLDQCRIAGVPVPASPAWGRLSVLTLLFCICIFPVAVSGQTKHPQKEKAIPPAATLGQWAAAVNLCTYPCTVGGSAAVLNNGKVLFYYLPGAKSNGGSQAQLLDPITGISTNVSLPFAGDIFCSGLSILPTGKVLVTGGNLQGTCPRGGCGTTTTVLFDPGLSTWTAVQNMAYTRWYPSSVELTDGTVLELSGSDVTGKVVQAAMESYNYTASTWTTLPTAANMPSDVLQPYPRMAMLPTGKVLLASPAAHTYLFDPVANLWSSVGNFNFGSRFFAPHVLLPGLEQVMVAGGSLSHLNGGDTATNTVEMIDMSVATPQWSYIAPMNYGRINANLVLLADGTVLAVGGGAGNGAYANPVFAAEVYDPKTGAWTVLASQAVQRTYHSTAVLLPDGRVVSAGSDNSTPTQVTYEIFSPPYLFNGPRPLIKAAPTSLTYGAKFNISSPNAATITRVALIRPGATTHADNFDQRYVDLTFTHSAGTIQATAPANGSQAPPGYYMLVIVNSTGIPSVMPFLYLGS
jgi:hypothetical protein